MPIHDELEPYFDDLNWGEWRATIVACLEDAKRRKALSVALLLEFGFEGFALLDDFLSGPARSGKPQAVRRKTVCAQRVSMMRFLHRH